MFLYHMRSLFIGRLKATARICCLANGGEPFHFVCVTGIRQCCHPVPWANTCPTNKTHVPLLGKHLQANIFTDMAVGRSFRSPSEDISNTSFLPQPHLLFHTLQAGLHFSRTVKILLLPQGRLILNIIIVDGRLSFASSVLSFAQSRCLASQYDSGWYWTLLLRSHTSKTPFLAHFLTQTEPATGISYELGLPEYLL